MEEDSNSQPPQPITWTASEYIAHEKDATWYTVLALSTLAVAGLLLLITRDFVSASVAIAAGLILGVYAGKKPREIEYQLGLHGVSIGARHYSYDNFRSFTVVEEAGLSSIIFSPLQRFSPPISLYYAPEDQDSIIAILVDRLPFEQQKPDVIERFFRNIRF